MNRLFSGWIMVVALALSAACSPTPEMSKPSPAQEVQQKITSTASPVPLPSAEIPTHAALPSTTAVIQSQNLILSSPLIASGGMINSQFTCSGGGISPPLQWNTSPEGTMSFVLIVEDPDAPAGVFVHWVLFNIPADRRDLPQGVAGDEIIAGIGVQGKNDAGKTGYSGPCPPEGAPHHYEFRLYALDTRLFLPAGLQKNDLEKGMEGHILAQAEFRASYQRMKGENGG